MKLWSKGFEPDKLIEEFTVGRDRELDLRLAKYDVEGSMAHIRMLESIGLLEKEELTVLLAALALCSPAFFPPPPVREGRTGRGDGLF